MLIKSQALPVTMTFSIGYTQPDDTSLERAVDWSWSVEGEWARSEKEGLGGRWETIPGLDKHSYQAILTHFGLEQYANLVPIEKIIHKSWQELGIMRREMEKKYVLPRKEITSATIGNHTVVP